VELKSMRLEESAECQLVCFNPEGCISMTNESRFNPFRVVIFVEVTSGSSFLATQG